MHYANVADVFVCVSYQWFLMNLINLLAQALKAFHWYLGIHMVEWLVK